MNDEPKSAAEMKEIWLHRKRTQEVEGIKAMAEIAAAESPSESGPRSSRAATGKGSRRPGKSAGAEGQAKSRKQGREKGLI